MPSKNISEIFCANLTAQLQKRNMAYSELANALGISKSTVSMWKNGTNLPRMELLDKIADYFGISVSDLTTEHSEKEVYYLNEETSKIAQEIFENKELRMLFDASRKAKPEDLKLVHDMMLALKRKEQGSSDEGC